MKTILSTILISLPLFFIGCGSNKKGKNCSAELATCIAECEERFSDPVSLNQRTPDQENCKNRCSAQKESCDGVPKGSMGEGAP